ncbi:MAG TPA: GGDEF domain-containing protein [Terriglobales bacterium]|nr:GGDEF domain-containing protein [Terriglobales bacterium]
MNFLTLAFANWVVMASCAAVLYTFAQPVRHLKGVGWLAHGLSAAALSIVLELLALRALLPLQIDVLIASAIMLGAFVLLRRGLCDLVGSRMRWLWVDATVLVFQSVMLAHFIPGPHATEWRFIIMSISSAAEAVLAIAVLWSARDARVIGGGVTLTIMAVYAAFHLTRAAASWLDLDNVTRQNQVQVVSATLQLVFTTMFALGAMWLATSERHDQVTEEARRDALTGVLNRRALRPALAGAVAASRATRAPLACLSLDLDQFKQVNDTRGHAAGDAALVAVARTLQETLRVPEAGRAVARLGGDEFVIILPADGQTNPTAAALAWAEQLRQAVARAHFIFEDNEISLTVSIGVTVYEPATEADSAPVGPDHAFDLAEIMLRRADRALYAAKHEGRNCTQVDLSEWTLV